MGDGRRFLDTSEVIGESIMTYKAVDVRKVCPELRGPADAKSGPHFAGWG